MLFSENPLDVNQSLSWRPFQLASLQEVFPTPHDSRFFVCHVHNYTSATRSEMLPDTLLDCAKTERTVYTVSDYIQRGRYVQ